MCIRDSVLHAHEHPTPFQTLYILAKNMVESSPVVMDELGSPVGIVGSEAGDPLQVAVVPVAGRHPLFPVIGDGPLGKVTHFRILLRIDVKAAGRGGSPDHVKPHSQRIRDVMRKYYSQ